MIFSSTIGLILALAPATLFAAPTRITDTVANIIPRQDLPVGILAELRKTNSLCDLSHVTLPSGTSTNPSTNRQRKHMLTHTPSAPTPLAEPSANYTLRHIAIGRGTQNYTCGSTTADEIPKANGAIASLFNATCDAVRLNDNVLADVTRLALNYAIPTAPEAEQRLSGHHEFTDKGVPLFNLKTQVADYGYVQAKPDTVKSAAPFEASKGSNGLGSVPWLKLNAVEGDYKEVFRVHTAGGVAPETCEGMQEAFTVEYSAEYWFYA